LKIAAPEQPRGDVVVALEAASDPDAEIFAAFEAIEELGHNVVLQCRERLRVPHGHAHRVLDGKTLR
jgi:hypothetical protein